MQLYDVTLNGDVVGSVRVTCEGLYTRFQCHCQLPDEQIYRLLLCCGEQEIDLGICVPMGIHFGVNKMCPNKQITDGDKVFRIIRASQGKSAECVPVLTDNVFDGISMLESARLYFDNGQYGILFDNQLKSK